jgi:hypothetical protein
VNNPEENKRRIFKYAFFSACVVLLVIILWSVVTETLIPLYRSKHYDEFIYNIFGIPLIIVGVGLFAYGGWIFVRDTHNLFDYNLQIARDWETIRDKTQPKENVRIARSENTRILFSTWKKGAFWLLIGAIFIIAGGLMINLKKMIG